MPDFDNPLGMPALGGLPQALIDIGGIGALICIPAGILAAVLRYRRGTLVERKQLKWFGSVLVLAFSMFFAATLLPQPYGQWAWIVASASIGLVPVAIGIAILRYRLYEIDRIVSRTIGWALVTGLLVAVFAGTIVGLQALLAPVTNNNTLAVAASTLVAAALFQPLRARVQRAVDRRFNRARVDAQRAIDAFGAHLRDDVDLGRAPRAARRGRRCDRCSPTGRGCGSGGRARDRTLERGAAARDRGPPPLLLVLAVGFGLARYDPFTLFFYRSYAAVGALLAFRRPRNAIGWLLVAIAFGFVGTTSSPTVDVAALQDGSATWADFLGVWAGGWAAYATFGGFLALMMLFPSGTLGTGRWRPTAILALGLSVAITVIAAFAPVHQLQPDGRCRDDRDPQPLRRPA